MHLSNVVAVAFKHEHVFDFKAVSNTYREVEGPRAWYQQALLDTTRDALRVSMKTYHESQILSCSYRTGKYLAHLDVSFTNCGSFLLN